MSISFYNHRILFTPVSAQHGLWFVFVVPYCNPNFVQPAFSVLKIPDMDKTYFKEYPSCRVTQ